MEKIIKAVGTHLNTIVDARPAKIVAGLEAENTCCFLQLLALAATTGQGEEAGDAAASPAKQEAPAMSEAKVSEEDSPHQHFINISCYHHANSIQRRLLLFAIP